MAAHRGFSLTSWNLLHAMAIPPTSSATLEGAIVKLQARVDSDLIALQEVDLFQERSDSKNQVERIAELMEAPYWAFAPSLLGTPGGRWSAVSDLRIYSEESSIPHQPMYGIGIVSKIPVKKWHRINLGRSRIGAPLIVPGENRPRMIYVADEPRLALVAELENGLTVSTTHLSFVPGFNILQLKKLARRLEKLPGLSLFTGDFNLPWGLGPSISGWNNLVKGSTYPSWKPSIEFDYIMSREFRASDVEAVIHDHYGISDHLASSAIIL